MKKGKLLPKQILPLLSITVALVYAVTFTVPLIPIVSNPLANSGSAIFLFLIVIAFTVSAMWQSSFINFLRRSYDTKKSFKYLLYQ